ncbi:MAG: MraY family glycosyltransferase [Thermodesulfobacteriota bacterium]
MTSSLATDISYYLLILFTGLFSGLFFVPLSVRIALRMGILDLPDSRKVHRSPLPRMGGLGMYLSFLTTILLCIKAAPMVQGIALGATISCFTGLVDDLYQIPPKMKFAGEVLASIVFTVVSGVNLPGFGDLFGLGRIDLGVAAPLVTVFCMVGVSNALNLSDGLDGLAGGIAAIAFFSLAVLAYLSQAWYSLVLSLAGLGPTLAFLRKNSYPAKLFMGDCGSLLLGFLLGAISVRLAHGGGMHQPIPPIAMATILAIPVADTLWVMGGRLRKGENPFLPDKTHLHHRLLGMGLAHRDVVATIYVLCALFGMLGVAGSHLPEHRLFTLTILAVTAVYTLLWLLENKAQNLFRTKYGKRLHHRTQVPRLLLHYTGLWLPKALAIMVASFFLPIFLIGTGNRTVGYFAVVCAVMSLLLYPWKGGRKEMPLAHAVFSMMIFCLVLFYMATPSRPAWIPSYLVGVEAAMLVWILPRLVYGRKMLYAIPSSFELILILFTWVVPIILAPQLGIPDEIRSLLTQSCLLSLPILLFFKQSLRRHARRNRNLAGSFILLFFAIGMINFLR